MKSHVLLTFVVAVAACAATALSGPERLPVGPASALAAVDPCASANCARITIDLDSGPGSGTVSGDPAGIACRIDAGVESGECTALFVWPRIFSKLDVNLTITPGRGSYLLHSASGTRKATPYRTGFALSPGATLRRAAAARKGNR